MTSRLSGCPHTGLAWLEEEPLLHTPELCVYPINEWRLAQTFAVALRKLTKLGGFCCSIELDRGLFFSYFAPIAREEYLGSMFAAVIDCMLSISVGWLPLTEVFSIEVDDLILETSC
jgi:hypothetical protein